jgi:hypothetical protein
MTNTLCLSGRWVLGASSIFHNDSRKIHESFRFREIMTTQNRTRFSLSWVEIIFAWKCFHESGPPFVKRGEKRVSLSRKRENYRTTEITKAGTFVNTKQLISGSTLRISTISSVVRILVAWFCCLVLKKALNSLKWLLYPECRCFICRQPSFFTNFTR